MSISFHTARKLLLMALLALPAAHAVAQQNSGEEMPAAAGKNELDTMQALENTWTQALLKHDQYALEGVLSPGFVDISAEGEVTTRNQQIARLFLKDSEAISFEQKVASVRMFGDIAVVNGTYVLRYSRNGRAVDDKGIFSHVFQRSRARWQCINSQQTFVVEQAAAKKQVSALPFHMPRLPGITGKAPEPAPTNPPATQAPAATSSPASVPGP